MKNGVVYLILLLVVIGFVGMMRIKTDVQQLVRERQKLASEQLSLKEGKRVLEAEYAMLASPVRLAGLAELRGFREMDMAQVVPEDPTLMVLPVSVTVPTVRAAARPTPVQAAVAAEVGAAAALLQQTKAIGGPAPAINDAAGRD